MERVTIKFWRKRNARRINMKSIKFFLTSLLVILFIPIKSYSLIEVDITRGNLNPLPVAVSPLSIDETSRKSFESLLKKKI